MKSIRITLTKEGVQATCTQRYRVNYWPDETTWQGNRLAFRFPDGTLIEHFGGFYNLPLVAAHFANLCGATYTIEDLGGEFIFSHDIVRGPSDRSDSSSSPNNNNL